MIRDSILIAPNSAADTVAFITPIQRTPRVIVTNLKMIWVKWRIQNFGMRAEKRQRLRRRRGEACVECFYSQWGGLLEDFFGNRMCFVKNFHLFINVHQLVNVGAADVFRTQVGLCNRIMRSLWDMAVFSHLMFCPVSSYRPNDCDIRR